ncbi:MAG: succinylglutamate desuccinylase/aspartoacylase family protein [Deltaproteobacteria bacterium]|nr:succinylglutamate desuccinylase/aspartoacylase family protein [Deltaproteobacteria bacterium]
MTDWIVPHQRETPRPIDALVLSDLAPGVHRLALTLIDDGAATPVRIPLIVVQGAHDGPTVGLTAAVHGNELNGIPTIHRLFKRLDPAEVRGTVVGATIVNVPGYLRYDRLFPDDRDLNRIFPGKPNGNESDVYAFRLVERLIAHFEVLLDLHTASFGRVNSYYVRADMNDAKTAMMARTLGAEIIVHNEGADGTLRACAADRGIAALTVEIGDPQVIDRGKVKESRVGLRDVLEELDVVDPDGERAPRKAVECDRSKWLYTDTGGILDVLPKLADRVEAGAPIAHLLDPWGQKVRTYRAPEAGVVVGRATNPVAPTGARILHLGHLAEGGSVGHVP